MFTNAPPQHGPAAHDTLATSRNDIGMTRVNALGTTRAGRKVKINDFPFLEGRWQLRPPNLEQFEPVLKLTWVQTLSEQISFMRKTLVML